MAEKSALHKRWMSGTRPAKKVFFSKKKTTANLGGTVRCQAWASQEAWRPSAWAFAEASDTTLHT